MQLTKLHNSATWGDTLIEELQHLWTGVDCYDGQLHIGGLPRLFIFLSWVNSCKTNVILNKLDKICLNKQGKLGAIILKSDPLQIWEKRGLICEELAMYPIKNKSLMVYNLWKVGHSQSKLLKIGSWNCLGIGSFALLWTSHAGFLLQLEHRKNVKNVLVHFSLP